MNKIMGLLLCLPLGGCTLGLVPERNPSGPPAGDDTTDDDDAADDDTSGDDDNTGDDDTSGDDDTTTQTDADNDGYAGDADCDDADPQTYPGAPELCDGLDNDCDGWPEEDGDGVCGIWILDAATGTWSARELDPSGAAQHAPGATIEAAFAVIDPGIERVWVLTHNTYHVLDPSGFTWVESGSRAGLFPQISGETLNAAGAVAAYFNGGGVASIRFYSGYNAWWYRYDISGGTFSYDAWYALQFPGQPAPDLTLANASWIDLDNDHGWVTESNPSYCGQTHGPFGPYYAVLESGNLHLLDGTCEEFFYQAPTDGWSIFTYSGAPDPSHSGAAAFLGDTLLLFGS